jgi:hypothetical protein
MGGIGVEKMRRGVIEGERYGGGRVGERYRVGERDGGGREKGKEGENERG